MDEIHGRKEYCEPVRNPDTPWGILDPVAILDPAYNPHAYGKSTGSLTALNLRPSMPEDRLVEIRPTRTIGQQVALETRGYLLQARSIQQYFNNLYDELAVEAIIVYDNGDGDIDEANRLTAAMGDALVRQMVLLNALWGSYNAYRVSNPANAWGNRPTVRDILGADPGQKLQVGVVDEDMGLLADSHHWVLMEEDATYQGVPQLDHRGVDVQRELFLAPVRRELKAETRSHFRTISGKEYR